MWRRRFDDESGIALIYVIFAVMVLAAMSTIFLARTVNETRATAAGRNREIAVHTAEAGAEALFPALNTEGDLFSEKVITEGPTAVSPSPADHVYDPPSGLAGEALQRWEAEWIVGLAEADWALAQISGYQTRVITTIEGQAFGVRPKFASADVAYDAVFGVGFVPSIDAPGRRVRVVKMLIARRYFSPDHALLTGGDLKFGGNANILAPNCDPVNDPDSCNANVHANGDIDVTGGAHVVEGSMTSSGTISGSPNTVGGSSASGEEKVDVPSIRARDFYGRDVTYNSDPGGQTVNWYDLCPDGTVHALGSSPCEGDLLWDCLTGLDALSEPKSNWYGWDCKGSSNPNQWSAQKVEAGIFYVYHGNASVNGSAGASAEYCDKTTGACYLSAVARAVSIMVEEDEANQNSTGSLEMSGNPSLVAAFPDTLFIVDNDLRLKGTAGGGSSDCFPDSCTDLQRYAGLIFVGEQLDVSGNVNLSGALIAQDIADQSNVVQRTNAAVNGTMVLEYDEDLKIDLTGRVTVEFWNELR